MPPVNILLVDDRPENLIALEAVLSCPEYNLISASSGAEALVLADVHDFALILLDIQMPGMSGLDVSRRLKEKERTRDIPIMMITAIFKEDPQVREGYAAGAVDYIGKPFDIEILRKKVGIYTQLHEHRRRLSDEEGLRKIFAVQLQARHEEVLHRSAEVTTLLESILDPAFVVWGDKVKESNSAALRMFGFDSHDEMEQDLPTFLDKTHVKKPSAGPHPYFQALAGEKSLGRVTFRHLKMGNEMTVFCAAHPVRFREKVLGVVMVHAPLSESDGPLPN